MSKSRSISKLSYEEGVFTAYLATSATGTQALTGGIGNGSVRYNNGTYIRTGNLIQVSCYYASAGSLNWLNGSNASNMWLAGLPFISKAETIYPAITIGYFDSFLNWTAAYTPMGIIENGFNTIRLGYATTNTFLQATGQHLSGANATICFTATYKTGP